MKKTALTLLAIILSALIIFGQQPERKNQPPEPSIDVQFNKNVEFIGFTFFLGSLSKQINPEEEIFNGSLKWKDWYAYDFALYRQYKSFSGSKDLEAATHFIEKTDGSDLFLLFLQLENFPDAKPHEEVRDSFYKPYSDSGDPAEGKRNAAIFIEALNRFYKEVNFDDYFKEHEKKYANALEQIKSHLPDNSFIPAMEHFYGAKFDRYALIPSLTIPTGMGFGAMLEDKGKTNIYNIFGPLGHQRFENDAHLDMGFSDEKKLRELSTHEFGHSFVNPVIAQLPKEIPEESSSLFEPIKTAMEDQSYINWQQCLGEHFVRAGEILIARNLGKEKEAKSLMDDYINNRKFIYLPLILEELEKYNKNREITYPEAVKRTMYKLSARAKK